MNTTRSQQAGGATRSAAIVLFGVAAVTVALVSIVALGGIGGGRGNDAGVGNGGALPPPTVTLAPTDRPTQVPTPIPSSAPAPTPETTDGGSDAMPIKVELENATGADVYVDIADDTGLLVGAVSGTPGEGASAEGYSIRVENLGPTALKLTWIDFPVDNALALHIDRFDGRLRFVLVQPEPTAETDAMAFDRELVLTFSEPIRAGDVETFLQDGLDTPG